MSANWIRGYADRPSARPGETLSFFISCSSPGPFDARVVRLRHGDVSPEGPGYREAPTPVAPLSGLPGICQRTQVGSYIEIPDPRGNLSGSRGLTIRLSMWPTTPAKRQGVISRWSERDRSGWAVMVEDGRVQLVVSDGKVESRVACSRPLLAEVWYEIVASFDFESKRMSISQESRVNSVNSRFGPVVDYDGSCRAVAAMSCVPADLNVPVLIAGLLEASERDRNWVTACFNGKIEAPQIRSGIANTANAVSSAEGAGRLLAQWDFAAEIGARGVPTDRISDVSGSGFNGTCVNQPDRGMTGHLWQGVEENFTHNPKEYAAIWFHEDSLDDCRWRDPVNVELPPDLRSGAYALVVEKDGFVDRIPFFVSPPRGQATAPLAVVLPTYSYLAYANSQVMQNAPIAQAVMGVLTTLDDRDLELNGKPDYGLSTYDYHADGRGVQYSSWRRPILNMRPDYRHEFGSVWQFPADLHLIDWLDHLGMSYDVITDHDLAEEGAPLLQRYAAAISPSHAEYSSRQMLDSWQTYLGNGGRGLYLGGNGFYWITSAHPEKPWLIEVRKGESGDQAWRARPGELYHSTSGERGGLWRHRARAPQKLWGVGYGSHGLDISAPYVQLPDAGRPENTWLMNGIAANEKIGDFGLVNGGASGLEMDRIDYALGTPPNCALLASSHGHSANAMLVPEEQYFSYPGMNGREHPLVRADIVYFATRNGGAVFSVGSMAWCGSLAHNNYENNVARLTRNVIDRFLGGNSFSARSA